MAVAVNSKWLYDAGFKKYNISQVTGITLPELDKAAAGIINYFNNGDEYLNVTIVKDGQSYKLYSEDEKQIIHMKDVKALFRLDYAVLAGSFVFIVLYIGVMLSLKKFRGVGWGLLGGGVLTVALMLILGSVFYWASILSLRIFTLSASATISGCLTQMWTCLS